MIISSRTRVQKVPETFVNFLLLREDICIIDGNEFDGLIPTIMLNKPCRRIRVS